MSLRGNWDPPMAHPQCQRLEKKLSILLLCGPSQLAPRMRNTGSVCRLYLMPIGNGQTVRTVAPSFAVVISYISDPVTFRVNPILHTAWLNNHALTLKRNIPTYFFDDKSFFLQILPKVCCESRKILVRLKNFLLSML
jgi:hypothetical protein